MSSDKRQTFVKPSHVTALVVHNQQIDSCSPVSPQLQLCRLYAGIRHLHFVFNSQEDGQFDRLRLPWHFIEQIRKSRRSSHKLYIHLCKSAFESSAFKSTIPEKYFPNVEQIIALKVCSHRERHDFIKGLKMDGLVFKKKKDHDHKITKDRVRKMCSYVPQTLDYKWQHCYIPERFNGQDQDKLIPREDLPNFEPNIGVGKPEQHRLRRLDSIRQHIPESSTLEYIVPGESKGINYPRITFEQGLNAERIGPLESNCKGHGDKKNCEKPTKLEQVKFTLSNLNLGLAVKQLVPRAIRKVKVRLL